MKKKSLSAKKTIHKSLLNHLNNNKVKKVFNGFKNYLDKKIISQIEQAFKEEMKELNYL